MCTYKYTHIHTDTHHLYILALEFEIQHMRQGCTQMKKIQKKKKKEIIEKEVSLSRAHYQKNVPNICYNSEAKG